MRPILFVLFLSACSSGAPTLYGQGMPVAPRPPAFSPTLDAPITVGQPGYIGPPEWAPRGTDKRVLPPTREPGIWASDSLPRSTGEPKILGVPIPFPPDTKAEADKEPTRLCASIMNDAVKRIIPDQALASFPAPWLPCLAAMLHKECGDMFVANDKSLRQEAIAVDAAQERRHRALLATAANSMRVACGPPLSAAEIQEMSRIIATFRTHLINDILSGGGR